LVCSGGRSTAQDQFDGLLLTVSSVFLVARSVMVVLPSPFALAAVILLRHWIVGLVAAALLLNYVFFLSGIVMAWRAERIAGDRGYCIQVIHARDPYDYQAAKRVSDLSLSTAFNSRNIWETPGKRAGHHAILVLDNSTQLMSWSYWPMDLRPGRKPRQVPDPSASGAYPCPVLSES
jgi:hypothetical protein